MRPRNIFSTTLMTLGVFFLLASSLAYAEEVRVSSSRARIRSGPGNYYKVVYTAYRGARLSVVSEKKGWYKVKVKSGKTGYVSKRSLGAGKQYSSRRTYRYSSKGKGVGRVSSGQIMAATRGVSDMGMFARQYAKNHDIDPALLEELSAKPFTEREFRKFASKLSSRDEVTAHGFSGAELSDIDYDVGAAIAMRILASSSPSRDVATRKYVALIGTAMADKTPLYDEEFIFIVLEDSTPQSYSAPGGYVFLTSGAIRAMDNEAELAGVLAHEIAHVTERHGISELEAQSIRINSEAAVDELDAEITKLGMDEGDREVAADLRAIADQLFERIISGRKRGDEDEADKLGTNLLYVRGYKATGLAEFVRKAGEAGSSSGEKTGTYRSASERSRMIKDHMRAEGISGKKGKDMEKRFRKTTR